MPPVFLLSRRGLQLTLLGAGAATFQALFSRAFLAAFSGQETVVAALLAAWLAATALGAAWARPPRVPTAVLLVVIGASSVGALVVARLLPRLFAGGASPGPAWALGAALVLLAAPCGLSGRAFARLAAALRDGPRAYLAESVGAAFAGTVLAWRVLGHAAPMTVAAAALLLPCLAASLESSLRNGVALMAAALAGGLALAPLGPWTLHAQGPHLQRAEERESAHGSLVVAHDGAQVTVYQDRVPVVSGEDSAAADEAAHVPLSLHAAPRRVAVLGIPPVGTFQRLRLHGVTMVDWVVEDPVLQQVLMQYLPGFTAPGVTPSTQDARRFLQSRPASLDAVLLFSGEPLTAAQNRLFTAEFHTLAAAALRPGGVLAVSLPGLAEQASPEQRRLLSSVARTLERALGTVRVLPGARTTFLAARGVDLPPAPELVRRILEGLPQRGVVTAHLDPRAVEVLWSPARLADATRWTALPEDVNQDLHPTTYRLALDRAVVELGEPGTASLLQVLALLLGALLLCWPRARAVEFAVLTSGGCSLGAQLLVVLAYQAASGALYQELALLLAGFMLGAALGAWLGTRGPARALVLGADLLMVVLLLGLGPALGGLVHLDDGLRLFAVLLTVAAGLVPGAQFAAATRSHDAGALYAADLLGAAAAALSTYTLLVPLLGLPGTALALAGVKALSTAALALPRPATVRPRAPWPALFPALAVLAVLAAAAEPTAGQSYAWTFSRPYQLTVAAAFLVVLLSAFETPALRAAINRIDTHLQVPAERLLFFLLLLPVAVFPWGRCYFQVPYVFCHACPRQCVFGVFRAYAVPTALVANLQNHAFCERVCPLGTLQHASSLLRPGRVRRWTWLRFLRVVVLVGVGAAYLGVSRADGTGVSGEGWYPRVYRNAFTPSAWVLGVAAALLLASLVIRRPFCGAVCPVGATSAVVGRVERALQRGAAPAARGGP